MINSARLAIATLLIMGGFIPRLAAGQGCSIPSSYTNRTSVPVGDLLVTLATDSDVYVVGTPVHIWLSFENTGTSSIIIPNPSMIQPMQGIEILPADCDSLDELGCPDRAVYEYPFGYLYFGGPVTILPGQCWPTQVIWDGVPPFNHTVVPGLHTVFGGMTLGRAEFHVPLGGVRLPILIEASANVPVVPATWGVIKSRFQ